MASTQTSIGIASPPPLAPDKQQPVSSQRLTLKCLQAGRAIAAALVVLVHLNGAIFGKPRYFPNPFWRGFSFGHAGVEYFFVLSGFIIVYIHSADIGKPQKLLFFLQKRCLRIYPVYWAVLLLALAALLGMHLFLPEGGNSLPTLLADVTLLPLPYTPDLAVAWTLKHEILFYGVFAAIIYNRRFGFAIAAAAILSSIFFALALSFGSPLALSAGASATSSHSIPLQAVQTIPMLFFNPMHLLFLYGACLVWFVKRCSVPFPALIAFLGVTLFFATGAYESYIGNANSSVLRSQLYGLGATIAMAGFIELERTGKIKVPALLCLMGDASYSLYLIHFPVLSILAKLVVSHRITSALPESVIFCSMFALALISGLIFHVLVERPLINRLK